MWIIGIWINTFLSNSVGYVACVGASSYYFSSNSQKEGSAEISLGFKWASVTNMGSLAFGAFLVTLMKIIRALAEQGQQNGNNAGGAAAVIGCICMCVVSCI